MPNIKFFPILVNNTSKRLAKAWISLLCVNFCIIYILTIADSFICAIYRIPPAGKSEKGDETDPIKPVFVGEFPQVVRDEQISFLRKHVSGL